MIQNEIKSYNQILTSNLIIFPRNNSQFSLIITSYRSGKLIEIAAGPQNKATIIVLRINDPNWPHMTPNEIWFIISNHINAEVFMIQAKIKNEFFGRNIRFDLNWPLLIVRYSDPHFTLSWCPTNKLALKKFKKWSRVGVKIAENLNFSSRFSRNFE